MHITSAILGCQAAGAPALSYDCMRRGPPSWWPQQLCCLASLSKELLAHCQCTLYVLGSPSTYICANGCPCAASAAANPWYRIQINISLSGQSTAHSAKQRAMPAALHGHVHCVPAQSLTLVKSSPLSCFSLDSRSRTRRLEDSHTAGLDCDSICATAPRNCRVAASAAELRARHGRC